MRQLKGFACSFLIVLATPSYAYAQRCYIDADASTQNQISLSDIQNSHSEILIEKSSSRKVDTGESLKGAVAKNSHHKKTREPLALKIKEDEFSKDLLAGSTFPIELEGQLSSKDSVVGDKVMAHLTEDLKIGDFLLAEKGTTVEGSVSKVVPACNGIKSNKLNKRYRNANGGIQIEFSKLLASSGSYEIAAVPARGSTVESVTATEQQLMVNNLGEISVPYHAGRYTALAIAISTGSMAGGPFGIAGAPVVSAFFGGIMPAYGLGRPAHSGEKHVRLKGALMGAVRGAPGGFLTSGIFVHGLEAVASSGDQITLRLNKNLSIPTRQNLSILPSP